MGRSRLLALMIMSAFVAGVSPTRAGIDPREHPLTVAELIAAVERAEPIDRDQVEHLIGRELHCEDIGDCEARDIPLAGVTVGYLDFRHGPKGSLLILKDFSGQCVSVDALLRRYPPNNLINGCTDGHTCMYWEISRRWGKLSIGVPDDPAPARCATSIVMDSLLN
jgi:hypothetical protein